jgi:hypothetical protein
MKTHILAALCEEFNQWEDVLCGLTDEQITTPHAPSGLSIKDVVAHLGAWQQRSIARVEAAAHGHEPVFPDWPAGLDPEAQASTDPINAWIHETYREQPWSRVHQHWSEGFQRFTQLAELVPEIELLDATRYTWMRRRPLALTLLGWYDHHQEHLDGLHAWLERV